MAPAHTNEMINVIGDGHDCELQVTNQMKTLSVVISFDFLKLIIMIKILKNLCKYMLLVLKNE